MKANISKPTFQLVEVILAADETPEVAVCLKVIQIIIRVDVAINIRISLSTASSAVFIPECNIHTHHLT